MNQELLFPIGDATLTVMFYLLAFCAVMLALAVVMSRRLLRAAVALMGVLSMSAGLYVLLDASFLAGVQVLVYVGGIVVLIVFAIMLTRSADLFEDRPTLGRKLAGSVVALASGCLVCYLMAASPFDERPFEHSVPNDVVAIGRRLLDTTKLGYVLPFEVVSLLLLAAVVGGIVIARRTPPIGQPFTSGGDQPGEADFQPPKSQREPTTPGPGGKQP